MRRFLERVLNLLRIRRPERDLAREIDAHLALLQDTFEARGLAPSAARRAARLTLGNIDQVKEQHRDARSFRWIEDAWQDAGYALRLLRRSPGFAATAALSVAIGIGANTAIFTVANALLFRPPTGVADPDALVDIGSARGDGGLNPLRYSAYLEIVRRATSFTAVFAQEMFPHVLGMAPPGMETAEPLRGRSVSSNFFTALGASPARGRLFIDEDEAAAILEYGYWIRRFDGDDRVLGHVLRINGRPVTVVGVAAPGFQGTGIQHCDVWLTFSDSRRDGPVEAGARLRPGMSVAAAAAEVRSIGDAVNRGRGAGDRAPRLNALVFSRAGGNRNVVLVFASVLMALISLVLVAACANVASILLTRATARAREMALRTALGAARGRLLRLLLTETAVLFLLGGLVGLGLARALVSAAGFLLPVLPTPVDLPIALDWHVLLFALALSMSAAVAFGVLPALEASKPVVGPRLGDGARSSSTSSRLRSAFVIGQIACSVLLVVLGASFVRVLRHAGAADPGFDARGVDIATLDLSVTGEPNVEPTEFWQRLIDRVRQTPAVEAASLARVPPGGWEGIGLGSVVPADRAESREMSFSPAWNIVDAGYFATLRIPLVAGRDFAEGDTADAAPVVILGETLARRFWPEESAIGKLLRLPSVRAADGHPAQRLATVIGVAADIRSSSLIDGLAEPFVYVPLTQNTVPGMTGQMSIVARRRGQANLGPVIATVVQEIDQRLVLSDSESLGDAIALGLTPQRVLATLGSVLGIVALLLASIGMYGVTSYTVALRRRELAIRLALGASRARVIKIVFSQGAWLVSVGLIVGLALAIGAGQILSVLFFGLPATHLPTLAGTVALVIVIGAAATLVPAGRAVRKGWPRALRQE